MRLSSGGRTPCRSTTRARAPTAQKMHEQFEKQDPKKRNEPTPIPEYQGKMIAAFDTYIKYVPDAPELPVIRYRKARIYYEYNHFDEAAKLFQEVVEKHPNHELAIYSANLLLDSLNAQGKTKEVVAWVDKFLEMPNLMKDPEFGKQMISLKSDTYDLEGREYEKIGNFKECGRSLLAAADALPDHPKHAERLWNAGQCFQNAHLVGQALKARQQLIKEHPKDALAQKALFRVAAGYHQLAYYSKAAENYEDFAAKFPGESKATEALGNATTFRIGLGESDKAIADMDSFVKFYGSRKPQDAAGVYFQMAEVYEKDKKYDELAASPRELPQEVGHARAGRTARFRRTSVWGRWPGRRPARTPPRTVLASRSSASPPLVGRRSSPS